MRGMAGNLLPPPARSRTLRTAPGSRAGRYRNRGPTGFGRTHAPTGREVVLRGVNIFRIADGKIVERWGRLDQLGLLQQLGLAPQPPAATAS